MKEEKTKSKKRGLYYFILAVCVLLLAAATVLTVYFVSNNQPVLEVPDEPVTPNEPTPPDEPDKPTGGEVENPYVAPLASTSYTLEYDGIYWNQTVGWIYRHRAIDFVAEEGTDVLSMASGTVKSVSYNQNTGNVVTVEHDGGLITVYRFIEPVQGLGVGQKVAKGETIGKIAAAYGSEYKDGTHLHFEVLKNGTAVNPTAYFEAVLEEK